MLSIIEGIRIATGGDGVNGIGNISASVQQGTSSNNSYSAFVKNLDKLEKKIINKLKRCKIGKEVGSNMTKEKEEWIKYFELGMYWFEREAS